MTSADQTKPLPAGIYTGDMPLPTRWYKYRNRVLKTQKQMAHLGDLMYEQIKAEAVIWRFLHGRSN